MIDKKIANFHDVLATGTKKTTSISPKNKNKPIITSCNEDNKSPIVKKEKNMGGRTPKNEKYAQERKVVLNRLLNIININEKNNVFFIDELENDEGKKKQILELVDDIKQYFSYCSWVYFSKTDVPHPCTSLVKSILKDMNIKSNSVSIRDNATNRVDKKGHKILL